MTELSDEEINLKTRLDLAFADMKSAVIIKKQYCSKGRKIFLPVMASLACVLFIVFIAVTLIVTIQYRYLLLVIESLVWAFIMSRLILSFVTDIKSQKFAEKITLVTDSHNKKFFYGEGKYIKKFEYVGGNIVLWGKNNYEKFFDKSSCNALASNYNKHLQHRSSNFFVLNAEFLFEKLREGSFFVGENSVKSVSDCGSFSVKFDGLNIKSIYYVGKPQSFYDSASPIHTLDCFLPFNYTISYTFDKINQINVITAPVLVKIAIKDYLLPEVTSESIVFK